jgi:hypothetical protein
VKEAKRGDYWRKASKPGVSPLPTDVDLTGDPVLSPVQLRLHGRCTILAGPNGTGKSRLISAVRETLGEHAVLVKLHELCEWLRNDLSKRSDFDDLTQGFDPLSIDEDMHATLRSTVGRQYDTVEWYAVEIDDSPFEPIVGASLAPFFRVSQHGASYTAASMGLGELSIHLLYWIMHHLREQSEVLVCLDEPDAFLPPRAKMDMTAELIALALKHHQSLLVPTHAAEVITTAVRNKALLYMTRDATGAHLMDSSIDPSVADHILGTPVATSELVLFCEDEAAYVLTQRALDLRAPDIARRTVVAWARGTGSLESLASSLPRHRELAVRFAIVVDEDQAHRATERDLLVDKDAERWPVLTLPVEKDPDQTFRKLTDDPEALAEALGVTLNRVRLVIADLEAADAHDLTNKLAALAPGRQRGLAALSDLWIGQHGAGVDSFLENVRTLLR